MTDGEASGNEDHDITDEHARLLHSGIILKPNAHRNVGRFDVHVLFHNRMLFCVCIISKSLTITTKKVFSLNKSKSIF